MKLSTKEWTCLDPDVGVWARTYSFTTSAFSNCFVVRIGESELAVISPPRKLGSGDFESLDALGKVVAICAPNGLHHLGIPGFVERYPEATLYTDAVSAKRIAKQQPSLPSFRPTEELASQLPDHVKIFSAPMLKRPDMMARVDTGKGYIWYSNDVLGNSPNLPKPWLLGKLFKWSRSGPGYTVNRLVLKYLGPQAGFGDWLKGEFEAHPPCKVVVGHGHVFDEGDVAAKSREVLNAGF